VPATFVSAGLQLLKLVWAGGLQTLQLAVWRQHGWLYLQLQDAYLAYSRHTVLSSAIQQEQGLA
jgi:hypothetical protein